MHITLNDALDQIMKDAQSGKTLPKNIAAAGGLDNDTITIELGGGSVIYERLHGEADWSEVPTLPLAGNAFT